MDFIYRKICEMKPDHRRYLRYALMVVLLILGYSISGIVAEAEILLFLISSRIIAVAYSKWKRNRERIKESDSRLS